MAAVAWVRAVPATFDRCVTSRVPDPPLDTAAARQQHRDYVTALEAGGYEIAVVDADDAFPDSAFIEDAAVVLGSTALATRSGHRSRRGETGQVITALAGDFSVTETKAPATLDGGDVLKVGQTAVVGLSTRTNREGAEQVASVARAEGFRPRIVPVGEVLHLKSGLSALDDETVLWHPSACERPELSGFEVVEIPGDDPEAANVVRLADGRILVAASHPETAAIVEAHGHEVVTVDVSEFARADGGLTCLSIRVR